MAYTCLVSIFYLNFKFFYILLLHNIKYLCHFNALMYFGKSICEYFVGSVWQRKKNYHIMNHSSAFSSLLHEREKINANLFISLRIDFQHNSIHRWRMFFIHFFLLSKWNHFSRVKCNIFPHNLIEIRKKQHIHSI